MSLYKSNNLHMLAPCLPLTSDAVDKSLIVDTVSLDVVKFMAVSSW